MKKKEKLKEVPTLNTRYVLNPVRNPSRRQLINDWDFADRCSGGTVASPSYDAWNCIVDTRYVTTGDNGTIVEDCTDPLPY